MDESITVFQWVANLSPWWWVAFGIGLGAVEMATMSFFLIWGDGGEPETALNNRSKQLVGRQAKVLSWDHGEGAVEIDGMRWRAVAENGGAFINNTPVNIVKAEGMTLTVTSA